MRLWIGSSGYTAISICSAFSVNFEHQWSEALDNLLNEIKATGDVEKGEEQDLLAPKRVTAFEEQYQKILKAGEEGTKTSDEPPEEQGKQGRKKTVKSEESPGSVP